VTYSNRAKVDLLAVPASLLEAHGAVSEEVAAAMAAGARGRRGDRHRHRHHGHPGPDGGTPEKPVGLVFVATDGAAGTRVRRCRFPGDRERVRMQATQAALEMTRGDCSACRRCDRGGRNPRSTSALSPPSTSNHPGANGSGRSRTAWAITTPGLRLVRPEAIISPCASTARAARGRSRPCALASGGGRRGPGHRRRRPGARLFPERGKARVLFLAMDVSPSVRVLQEACEAAALDAGLPAESRPFVAHVTLGRWRAPAPRPTVPPVEIGLIRLDTLTLYRSDLHPAGAVHVPLCRFRLAG
jgi:PncC family amidohydrolase